MRYYTLDVFVSDDGKAIRYDPLRHRGTFFIQEPILDPLVSYSPNNEQPYEIKYRLYYHKRLGGLTKEALDAARRDPDFLIELLVQAGLITSPDEAHT